MTAAKLSEEEILKGAKYVDTLFKPAANKQFCRWVILDSIISDHTHVNHNSRANHHNLSPQTKHSWTLIGADNVVTFSQYLVLNLAKSYIFYLVAFLRRFHFSG